MSTTDEEKGGRESSPGATYKVLVAIDFKTAGAAVLRRAMELAARGHARSEIHVVSVIETQPTVYGRDLPSAAAVRLHELATNVVKEVDPELGERIARVVVHVLVGSPAQEITWLAAHLDADLIVLGTHGRRGVGRFMLGSVAEVVVRTAGCPVLVDRPKAHPEAWRQPAIEPPCEDCLAKRNETHGAEAWCERHAGHHVQQHVYSWNDTSSRMYRPWGFVID